MNGAFFWGIKHASRSSVISVHWADGWSLALVGDWPRLNYAVRLEIISGGLLVDGWGYLPCCGVFINPTVAQRETRRRRAICLRGALSLRNGSGG